MNIIVDSTFNPFSYRDLMLPIYDYKLAYEETEAAYSDLVTQTEAWKDIANKEKSPEAYAMYKNYAAQLNAIVDDFSLGMNSRNRRQLIGMKRRYASEITPIAKASEAMNAANAVRDLAGPDAIFEEGRYDSLDRFLHGQTANNERVSRKDIVSRTAALTLATAQSILEDPIIRLSMSSQFLEVIQKRGLGSLGELQAAIAGNPEAANRFALIKEQMINQVGGLDRFDAAGKAAVEGAINEGLYAGLNNYSISLQQDGEYMTKALRASDANQDAELQFKKELLAANLARGASSDGPQLTPSSQLKNLMATISKPLYFNAGGLSGDAAHRDTSYYTWQGNSSEGYEHSFSLLEGKGKTRALDYIGKLIGVSDFATVYNDMNLTLKSTVDEVLEQNVKVWRDLDWFSDNHFAVYLRGTDYLNPGTPGNEAELMAAYQAIRALAAKTNYSDVKPK